MSQFVSNEITSVLVDGWRFISEVLLPEEHLATVFSTLRHNPVSLEIFAAPVAPLGHQFGGYDERGGDRFGPLLPVPKNHPPVPKRELLPHTGKEVGQSLAVFVGCGEVHIMPGEQWEKTIAIGPGPLVCHGTLPGWSSRAQATV